MVAATQELIRLVEEEEHMQVSRGARGKTVALGSTKVVRERLGGRLAIKRVIVENEVRNLALKRISYIINKLFNDSIEIKVFGSCATRKFSKLEL